MKRGGHKFVKVVFRPLTCSFNPISGILHNGIVLRGGVISKFYFKRGGVICTAMLQRGGSCITLVAENPKWPAPHNVSNEHSLIIC